MHESVRSLGVGTYNDIQYVYPDTPLIECLAKLTSRHMSAVPVVERDSHHVVDIYARFDAIGLAAQQSYGNLDKTVAEALQHRKLSNVSPLKADSRCYVLMALWHFSGTKAC